MYSFAENDYAAWEQPLFGWTNIEEFSSAPEVLSGIHRIALEGGPTLDVLVSGEISKSNGEPLPIFFNGAVADREKKLGPFFSGRGIAEQIGSSFASISDPSTSLEQSLGLAWYAGNSYSNLVLVIEGVLRTLARISGRRLLLIGGSGGGFAALHFGSLLGELATVIAWNPQTDIFEYNPEFVRRYLQVAFAGQLDEALASSDWKNEAKRLLRQEGVRTEVLTLESRPGQAVVFQNASDWHVSAHLAPFIQAWGMRHQGGGIYRDRGKIYSVISDFGEGHATLPADTLISVVQTLSAHGASVESLFDSGNIVETLKVEDVRLLPRDLRGIRDAVIGDLSLELSLRPSSSIAVNVRHRHSPQGIGRMRYRYFTEGTSGKRTYKATSLAANSSIAVSGSEKFVGVSLSDGFLNEVGELKAEISWPDSTVFILGSCVSRDSFEDPRAPKLAGYVARTSLASAFSERPHIAVDLLQNPSPFQRRMVQTDINKELKERLQSTHFDLLLVDLIDERLGLMNDAGGYYTDSPELRACKFLPNRDNNIPLGSQEYYDAFDRGLGQLLETVPSTKIVVNEAYWATVDIGNQGVADPEVVQFNNAVLKVLYDKLRAIPGVRFISHEAEVMRADPSHKWGVSPFHFGKDFESSLIAGLRTISISQ